MIYDDHLMMSQLSTLITFHSALLTLLQSQNTKQKYDFLTEVNQPSKANMKKLYVLQNGIEFCVDLSLGRILESIIKIVGRY